MNNIIKIEAKLNRVLFPKFPIVLGKGDNTTGIVSWYPILVLDGEPEVDKTFGTITIKGTYEEDIDANKNYRILAKEKFSEQWGMQYELIWIGENLNLTNTNNQKAFLKTFLTDNQINEMFKILDNPLKSIEDHNINDLKKVKGIGEYIANCIIERFEDNKDNCEIYLQLDEFGLTPAFIQKLIKRYRNPKVIIDVVKNNPYKLTYDIDGIGFKTADKIALKVGISEKSPSRIKAYINYKLEELASTGNSYITSNELTSHIFTEFNGKDNILEIYKDENGNVIGNNIGQAIDELKENNVIVVEESDNRSDRRVYLRKYYELEEAISDNLKRIASAGNRFKYDDWEQILVEQELKQGWKFTEEQKQGIKLGLDKQVCFITGGAGSGKSSLVSGIVECLKGYNLAQTALAGKASARLQEVTGKEGYTIHRLLKYKPFEGFTYNRNNPLDYDIIILDEISLVGGDIFLSLIEAISEGTKLIILGDMGQLESIGSLNLAHDIYKSNYIPVVELTKTHRQAQKSGIITVSKAIRESKDVLDKNFTGEITFGELQDMHFISVEEASETRDKVLETFKKMYDSELVNCNIMDIQVLAPVKERGNSSVFNLNNDIQEIVNPRDKNKNEIELFIYNKDENTDGSYGKKNNSNSNRKSFILREGDKVMCIKNDYNIKGLKRMGVFNGWVGIILKINLEYGFVDIYFPIINDTMTFTKGELSGSIILGYASTIHKYQGSSSKCIIGVMDNTTPPDMRTKELAYTLVTRAEKDCTFIVQNSAFRSAVKKSGINNKNTFLIEMLDEEDDDLLEEDY